MEAQIQQYNKEINKYELTPEAVSKMVEKYHALNVIENDRESYKSVRKACTKLVHVRTSVDKRRKELGEEARTYVNNINQAAKQLLEPLAPLEERFKAEMKAEDDRKAAIKAEKERIERERVETIRVKIDIIRVRPQMLLNKPSDVIIDSQLELEDMVIEENEYQEFTDEAKTVMAGVITSIEKIYKDRVQFEKEEAERKAEAERLEKIRKEQEEAQRKIDEENRKIQEEKDRIQREYREAQIKEKARKDALREAQEKAEREERERKEKEEAERKEKERQEALRPDKEKLIKLSGDIISFLDQASPKIKDQSAYLILSEFIDWVAQGAAILEEKAKQL